MGGGKGRGRGKGKGKVAAQSRNQQDPKRGLVWKSKGAILLNELLATESSSVSRLCGAPLSTDEFLLGAMATREDDQGFADIANMETFGEDTGWDVEEMLAAGSNDQTPASDTCAVGTCGFMGVAPKKYAARFNVVELNFTYHDRGDQTYEDQATNYARLGLHVVVKVSGYATHEMALASPIEWWPWLRSKYSAFMNAGILIGLLWQLPPSFENTSENLQRISDLGFLLRAPGQLPSWFTLKHVFEFRHSSWFGDSSLISVMQQHLLCMAHIHVTNDTGWAGDLESGWHGGEDGGDFVYFRCFGTSGRSLGKYNQTFLKDLGFHATCRHGSSVVMFGQGDLPSQALGNARELQDIVKTGKCDCTADSDCQSSPGILLSGKVVGRTRGWDVRIVLDVGGRRGLLGTRHIRKRGLNMQKGSVLTGLRVEAVVNGVLLLSIAHAGVDECVTEVQN